MAATIDRRVALITGITGQVRAFLVNTITIIGISHFLLKVFI